MPVPANGALIASYLVVFDAARASAFAAQIGSLAASKGYGDGKAVFQG